MYYWDNQKSWLDFPNFQGHHTIKNVKMNLVYTLFPEPIGGFWLNLHTNTIENWEKKNDLILMALTTLTLALWMSNFDLKACLHPISWTKWWILAKLYVLYHWDD